MKQNRMLHRGKYSSALLAVSLLCLSNMAVLRIVGQSVQNGASPLREPLPLWHPVQDKNFYLLSLIERMPQVKEAVEQDPDLSALFKKKLAAIEAAESGCRGKSACTIDAVLLTKKESGDARKDLESLYDTSPAVRGMVAGPMRQSGVFILYSKENDKALLGHAWKDAAEGINRILEVYGKGAKPHYDAIDSASFDVNSSQYWTSLHTMVASLSDTHLFFEPALRLSLMLLNLNHYDDAGRFEPLDKGENALTIAHLKTIVWNKYPYTAILIPGHGPSSLTIPITPQAKVVTAHAAGLFRQGKAPLIIVSGGFVHPARTRYAEAIEMRRFLIERCGIPANVILIDPHARHSTTNWRNADRLIYRYGIPMDKPVLVALRTPEILEGILSQEFDQRNMDELGYLPYRGKEAVTVTEMSFYPVIEALQADSRDPRDP